MDDLERRLIELNDQLITLHTQRSELYSQQIAQTQIQKIGGMGISSIKNEITIEDCDECEPEECDDDNENPPTECCEIRAIVVSEDYLVLEEDYYVGVNAEGPTTITLPTNLTKPKIIIIKAEMGPPVGNKKVTIVTDNNSDIDGVSSIVLQSPYEVVQFLFHDGYWNVTSQV